MQNSKGKENEDRFQVQFTLPHNTKKSNGSTTQCSYGLFALGLSCFALILFLHWPLDKLNQLVSGPEVFSHAQLGLFDFMLTDDGTIEIAVDSSGHRALHGTLGLSLPKSVGPPKGNCTPGQSDFCIQFGDYARLYITKHKTSNGNCGRIEWYSPFARRLEDCFDLQEGVHWYGGGGPTYVDTWPIETVSRQESAVVSGNTFGSDYMFGGVTENYWLISSGVAIHVDEDVPLFISINSTRKNQVCFVSSDIWPYKNRGEARLKYDICVGSSGETFKDVHLRALGKYYDRPSSTPDERMLVQPLWSTWAEYKTRVSQSIVTDLAHKLVQEGFGNSSHIELDDLWETCYGDMEFNSKFLDPAGMTKEIRALGFRTTLWIHPFINFGCPSFKLALDLGFLVKDKRGKVSMTQWWNGKNAGIIDFTNEAAVTWWTGRLKTIQSKFGIDSFKFDAGESNWLPYSHHFKDVKNDPGIFTQKYVQAVAQFGGLVEVRSARRTQNEAIFVRMLDKDSRWGYDNGLRSLIPTLLDFGIKGYPFVMPDMIGGNAYSDGKPSKELFIRWMQLSTFMPCVQFSVLPWEYDSETLEIVRGTLDLRFKHSERILNAARQATIDGSPINRPIWWADPSDNKTLTIDDQYLLGDDILVAPVTKKGAIARDVYLPKGHWLAGSDSKIYQGPMLLQNYSAALNVLPYFVKQLPLPSHQV